MICLCSPATPYPFSSEQLRRKELKLQQAHLSVTAEHALLSRDNSTLLKRLSDGDSPSEASSLVLPGYEALAPRPHDPSAIEREWVDAEFGPVAELLTSCVPQPLVCLPRRLWLTHEACV